MNANKQRDVNTSQNTGNESNTYMHKFKGGSGLEFIVLSWDKDWPRKHYAIDPESGDGAMLLDTVETTEMVYSIPNCFEPPENSDMMRRATKADGSPVLPPAIEAPAVA